MPEILEISQLLLLFICCYGNNGNYGKYGNYGNNGNNDMVTMVTMVIMVIMVIIKIHLLLWYGNNIILISTLHMASYRFCQSVLIRCIPIGH